jgi:hypothetical protein
MVENQPSEKYPVPNNIVPYVKAMQKAAGLSQFDAITSVLFAMGTHIDLEHYPMLVYLGVAGSGKSSAMKQLLPMCKGSKWIKGKTEAAQRSALKGVRTAFVEEADNMDTNLTDLYTRRYSRETGTIEVLEKGHGGTWQPQTYDIFGATVMHRRVSIADVGLRSRCIIIRTKSEIGNYGFTQIGDISGLASKVSEGLKRHIKEMGGVDRVQQTWNPVYLTAQELGMEEWAREAFDVINQEAATLKGGQGYEPSEAILRAVDILSRDTVSQKRTDISVRVSQIVGVLKEEFVLTLKPSQIKEEAEAKGFETGMLHGYQVIKVKKELLDKLLPEEG